MGEQARRLLMYVDVMGSHAEAWESEGAVYG